MIKEMVDGVVKFSQRRGFDKGSRFEDEEVAATTRNSTSCIRIIVHCYNICYEFSILALLAMPPLFCIVF